MRQLESFFWGIIAALGALFIELLIFIAFSTYTNPSPEISFSQLFILPQFIIIAACIEEFFKYLIISKRIEMFSLEKSYIINSLFVGAGFVITEFWLLVNSGALPSRQILGELAIIHIGTAGLIGYIIGTKNPSKMSTFLQAVAVATIFHTSYNFLIQKREYIENYSIFLLLGALVIINLFNLLRISGELAQD